MCICIHCLWNVYTMFGDVESSSYWYSSPFTIVWYSNVLDPLRSVHGNSFGCTPACLEINPCILDESVMIVSCGWVGSSQKTSNARMEEDDVVDGERWILFLFLRAGGDGERFSERYQTRHNTAPRRNSCSGKDTSTLLRPWHSGEPKRLHSARFVFIRSHSGAGHTGAGEFQRAKRRNLRPIRTLRQKSFRSSFRTR